MKIAFTLFGCQVTIIDTGIEVDEDEEELPALPMSREQMEQARKEEEEQAQ